jgi:hypothetical protein
MGITCRAEPARPLVPVKANTFLVILTAARAVGQVDRALDHVEARVVCQELALSEQRALEDVQATESCAAVVRVEAAAEVGGIDVAGREDEEGGEDVGERLVVVVQLLVGDADAG